jgi:hypothetical protein
VWLNQGDGWLSLGDVWLSQGDGWLSQGDGWLRVARLLATAALWVRIQTSL